MNLIEIEELSQAEVQSVDGGSFGYDVGIGVRFLYQYAVNGGGSYGTTMAVADYAANSVKCDC